MALLRAQNFLNLVMELAPRSETIVAACFLSEALEITLSLGAYREVNCSKVEGLR